LEFTVTRSERKFQEGGEVFNKVCQWVDFPLGILRAALGNDTEVEQP